MTIEGCEQDDRSPESAGCRLSECDRGSERDEHDRAPDAERNGGHMICYCIL